ncbi:MAG TPA: OsmC family protein [Acidimicrobiales bacterium]|nr:OsmC family protein [Acidimicrobiales bacterium]
MSAVEDPTASTFEVRLDQQDLYRFGVDFGLADTEPLVVDEPPPLGEAAGPNASRLLAAAVGHCLSASALYCLNRARIPVSGVHTTVTGRTERNERGRLRVAGLAVTIDLDVAEADRPRMGRCLELFEDFCVVTASVRGGIPVEVNVAGSAHPVARTQIPST